MSDIDLEKYRRHVAHFKLPQDKETELLRAIWNIMQNFVDRAFGEDAAQLALRAGGKSDVKDASGGLPVLESGQSTQQSDDLADAFRRKAGNGREKRDSK